MNGHPSLSTEHRITWQQADSASSIFRLIDIGSVADEKSIDKTSIGHGAGGLFVDKPPTYQVSQPGKVLQKSIE